MKEFMRNTGIRYAICIGFKIYIIYIYISVYIMKWNESNEEYWSWVHDMYCVLKNI